ncbi:hypothetical protein [Amycolatopsis sp. NPDC003861]
MAQVLDAESLTRRHWQVLNTIALGARTPEQVDAAMAPFVTGEGSTPWSGAPPTSKPPEEYPGAPRRQVR